MSKRMLIDATQPDETRVVVLDGGRVEEIDVEISSKKQIKSNIYLARVTRVEPSLQAAFVDYGGNRHGFLPFSEIHPDYYQIPIADREALLQEVADLQNQAQLREEDEDDAPEGSGRGKSDKSSRTKRVRKGRGSKTSKQAGDVAGLGDQPEIDHEAVDASADGRRGKGKRRRSTDLAEVAFIPIRPIADLKTTTALDMVGDASVEAVILPDQPEVIDEVAAIEIESLVDGTVAITESDDETPPTTMAAMIDGDEDAVIEDTSEEAEAEVEEPVEKPKPRKRRTTKAKPKAKKEEASKEVTDEPEKAEAQPEAEIEPESEAVAKPEPVVEPVAESVEDAGEETEAEDDAEDDVQDNSVEEAELEHRAIMRNLLSRRYKIQEVIKRRQILLVQVSKEERGNKGAALTTYLSLAGRYCVLMPNTSRGGGISRKIASVKDRKRLKRIVDDLDMPTGISVIVRTAGSERSKTEIQRDYDYLVRTWDKIRNDTLESSAPTLIHEEGDIIKRAIRDIYTSDMDEIVVDGKSGYKDAKAFMKMLSPTHSRRVKEHSSDEASLFVKEGIERELETLHEHIVQLPSGGYIVLNQTEALVAVDVNSGRAIKERHIEDTALNTNLEAADEVARQLRLRDLAGLVVIDFIDMEETKNNSQVERRLRDALRFDRARVQTSRISSFGLLELSRQRIRPSVMEATHVNCVNCAGTGLMRSAGALALSILRSIEERLADKEFDKLILSVPAEIALALLNDRRAKMNEIERRLGYPVVVQIDASLARDAHLLHYEDQRHGLVEIQEPAKRAQPSNKRPARSNTRRDDKSAQRNTAKDKDEDTSAKKEREEKPKRGRKTKTAKPVDDVAIEQEAAPIAADGEDEDAKKKRKRGKRGGKKRQADKEETTLAVEEPVVEAKAEETVSEPAEEVTTEQPVIVEETPLVEEPAAVVEEASSEEQPVEEKPVEEKPVDEKPADEKPKKKRIGWWSRK